MWALAPLATAETYREYVTRSNPAPPASLAAATAGRSDHIAALIPANEAFLERVTADRAAGSASPAADARVAVPLLLQVVRDWSAEGALERAACYAPVVAALRERLAVEAPRILVPGSGVGRLAFDLSATFPGADVVAVEPDEPSQLAAATLMQPATDAEAACEAGGAAAAGARRGGAGQQVLYPALHLSTDWARAADRLRPVFVPDLPPAALAAAQHAANVSLVVGAFPEALAGGPMGGPHGADVAGRGFDAAATVFFLDVLPDLAGALAALRALLAPTRGVWVNLGPLTFPAARGVLGGPVAPPLAYDELRALVLAGGFALLDERQLPCEYNALPGQMRREVRTCFYFVAQPTE